MSSRVLAHWKVIQLLSTNLSSSELRSIIVELSLNQILTICEIAVNILYGNITISPENTIKLKKRKKILFYLADKKNSIKSKKLYIVKHRIVVQELIKSAQKHISSLYKEKNEKSREKRVASME
jgi:hypothetical protein